MRNELTGGPESELMQESRRTVLGHYCEVERRGPPGYLVPSLGSRLEYGVLQYCSVKYRLSLLDMHRLIFSGECCRFKLKYRAGASRSHLAFGDLSM